MNKARWVTAMHEASHANAYLSFNIIPDGAELFSDEEGKVYHNLSERKMAARLKNERLREQYAVISFAGIVMEMICNGHDVSDDLIIGDNRDLQRVTEYGYTNDYERMSIQLEALSIVVSSQATIESIAGVLYYSGSISRKDVKILWDYNQRKQA
jgi:hypothetical protein